MVSKNKEDPCPVCKLPLSGNMMYIQRSGDLKPQWYHRDCVFKITSITPN